ncbi:hypothetical protein DAEQUDRAFT_730904 [Daedalea quercina L-15889]|uniref:Uncharacterized protein n=1 Tax=Daedalea quercina L-15889 TaxID=1314783 RepID=A0A165MLT6_9APHY|nr:hypothetical protein DAEQUDRAFT_730904 [Daedalea quercina L-15889]
MASVEPTSPALPEPPSRPKRVPATPSTRRNITNFPPRASPGPASRRKQVPTAPSAAEDVVEHPRLGHPDSSRQPEQPTSLLSAGKGGNGLLARVVETEIIELDMQLELIRLQRTALLRTSRDAERARLRRNAEVP